MIGIPFLWLFMFFLLPFVIVLKISFAEADVAIPPYTEIYQWADNKLTLLLNFGNYIFLTEDALYLSAYLGSLKVAFFSTLLCLVIGYPMAYAIARAPKERQTVLLLLIMMPTWTAILIRVYAWMGILGNNGLLNSLLIPWLDAASNLYVNEVANPEVIDNDWKVSTGAPKGPFETYDIVGFNVAVNIARGNPNSTEAKQKFADLLDERGIQQGKAGLGDGVGFYEYDEEGNIVRPNPDWVIYE